MKSEFWIGLLLTIPLSIISNILVAPLQRWWAARGLHSRNKKIKQLQMEYSTALYYSINPELMNSEFILTAIGLIFLTFFMVLCIFMRPIIFDIIDMSIVHIGIHHRPSEPIVFVVNVIMIVIASTYCVNLFSRLVSHSNLYHRVKRFPEYIKELPDEVRDQKMEEIVKNVHLNRWLPGMFLARNLRAAQDHSNSQQDGGV